MSEAKNRKQVSIHEAVWRLIEAGYSIGVRVFIPPVRWSRDAMPDPHLLLEPSRDDRIFESKHFTDSQEGWIDATGETLRHLDRVDQFVDFIRDHLYCDLRFESALLVYVYPKSVNPHPNHPNRFAEEIMVLFENGKKKGLFKKVDEAVEMYEKYYIDRFLNELHVPINAPLLGWIHPKKSKAPRHPLIALPLVIDANGPHLVEDYVEYAWLPKKRDSSNFLRKSILASGCEEQILDFSPEYWEAFDQWIAIFSGTKDFYGSLSLFQESVRGADSILNLPKEQWDDGAYDFGKSPDKEVKPYTEEKLLNLWNRKIEGLDRHGGIQALFWSLYVEPGKKFWKSHRSCGYCGIFFTPPKTRRKKVYCLDDCRKRMNQLRQKHKQIPEATRKKWRKYSWDYHHAEED